MGWIVKGVNNHRPNVVYGKKLRGFIDGSKKMLEEKMTDSIGRFMTDEVRELLKPKSILMLERGTAHIVKCGACNFYFISPHKTTLRYGINNNKCYICRNNWSPSEKYRKQSEVLGLIKQDIIRQQNEIDGIVETDNAD